MRRGRVKKAVKFNADNRINRDQLKIRYGYSIKECRRRKASKAKDISIAAYFRVPDAGKIRISRRPDWYGGRYAYLHGSLMLEHHLKCHARACLLSANILYRNSNDTDNGRARFVYKNTCIKICADCARQVKWTMISTFIVGSKLPPFYNSVVGIGCRPPVYFFPTL